MTGGVFIEHILSPEPQVCYCWFRISFHYFGIEFRRDFSAWYFGMEFWLEILSWKNLAKTFGLKFWQGILA